MNLALFRKTSSGYVRSPRQYSSSEECCMEPTESDSKKKSPTVSRVNLARLRSFAAEALPAGSPLREILLEESDEVYTSDFLARLPIYLRLIRLEVGRRE
jgi:hypothetical protein